MASGSVKVGSCWDQLEKEIFDHLDISVIERRVRQGGRVVTVQRVPHVFLPIETILCLSWQLQGPMQIYHFIDR